MWAANLAVGLLLAVFAMFAAYEADESGKINHNASAVTLICVVFVLGVLSVALMVSAVWQAVSLAAA